MPLGLWKSKWEIHREEMAIYRQENDRRHAEWREQMDRREAEWAEWKAERAKVNEEWRAKDEDWKAERAKADEEWRAKDEESRRRHDALMARIDENHRETMAAFQVAIAELRAVRREVHDLVDAVNANTEAILRLIDRFDEWEGRPPGPPDLRSV
jgi:hypothetical protein